MAHRKRGRKTYERRDGEVLTIGSRRQVWNRTAKKTSGGLRRRDLMKNKEGRIVSRKMHKRGKRRDNPLRCGEKDYIAEAKRGEGYFSK